MYGTAATDTIANYDCSDLIKHIGISMDELIASSSAKKEEYIKGLCMLWVVEENECVKNELGNLISAYIYKCYFKIINTYGAERDDVFQGLICEMLRKGIKTYVAKSRSSTFEAHVLTTAKDVAYKEANQHVKSHIVFWHKKIRDISEQYGIALCVGNAYKFEKLLHATMKNQKSDRQDDLTINKVITIIENYATIGPLPEGKYE